MSCSLSSRAPFQGVRSAISRPSGASNRIATMLLTSIKPASFKDATDNTKIAGSVDAPMISYLGPKPLRETETTLEAAT